ncbi:MAG: hypothetical protein IKT39_02650 [Clostridia bacterium]|nr:hypothetical protein [Clostridia bacterium]
MKRRRGASGILIIGVGVSVIITVCMPSSWLVFLLGILLIWAGFSLLCK